MLPKRSVAAVLIGFAASILSAQDATNGPSIGWHATGSGGPPQNFELTPASPTTADLISFVAPTDGQIYENDCFASTTCGLPMIVVDSIFQKVNVSFSAPPNWVCPLVVAPVSGVEGEFGPLRAGAWTFNLLGMVYNFEVIYTPVLLSVEPMGGSRSIQVSWPASGETFVLESSANLGSGNWAGVTNSPTTVSNRVTVLIDSAPGTRLFRLHRLPLGEPKPSMRRV